MNDLEIIRSNNDVDAVYIRDEDGIISKQRNWYFCYSNQIIKIDFNMDGFKEFWQKCIDDKASIDDFRSMRINLINYLLFS